MHALILIIGLDGLALVIILSAIGFALGRIANALERRP